MNGIEVLVGARWQKIGDHLAVKVKEAAAMVQAVEPIAGAKILGETWRKIHADRRQREADAGLKNEHLAGEFGDWLGGIGKGARGQLAGL